MRVKVIYTEREAEGTFAVRFYARTEEVGRSVLPDVPAVVPGFALSRAIVMRRVEREEDGEHLVFSRGARAEVRLDYVRTDELARMSEARARSIFDEFARRAAA